jgi:hypothetical protein
MKRIPRHPIIVSQLVAFAIASLIVPPELCATDGTNGTSGPASLDADTDQLFDSQHPNHTLVVGSQTVTLTGHGTATITGLGTLYGENGIAFRNTATLTASTTYTQTTTGTIPVTQVTTASGTGTITGTATTTGTGTASQSVTVTMPSTYTTLYTGTTSQTGTHTQTRNNYYYYTATITVTKTLTSTASVSGTGTGTATGTGTGTGTVSGTASASQTAIGTCTSWAYGLGNVTETYVSTSTASSQVTATVSQTWTASRSEVVTATQNTVSTTAGGTGTGTWTNTNTASAQATGTYTNTSTSTLTVTSNSASVASSPTVVNTYGAPSGVYMLDINACDSQGGLCPPATWGTFPEGSYSLQTSGITSSSGVVTIGTVYSPCSPGWVWPSGVWRMRMRAYASALASASYVRAEVIVYGKDTPGTYACTGDVSKISPTGMEHDFLVTFGSADVPRVGGPTWTWEQQLYKNFYYEPNYPSGWNVPCSTSGTGYVGRRVGVRLSAYTTSTTPVTITIQDADLETPAQAKLPASGLQCAN